jgi:hypothetical protein
MPKNVIITPATGLVEFKGASGNTDARIQLDDSGNLNLTSPNGDVSIGDTTSDLLIGDGVTSVDIIFEQSGDIRALAGKTLTLGQSDSNITVASPTTFNSDITVTGNLTVNGTTTTVNSTTLTVDDINIELGSVASPTDVTANGGGITLKGATDKTLNWVSSTTAWTSSEDFNLLTGKVYEINGTSVLSATTLGSGVTGSSLTSVGTIGTGVWQGTLVAGQYGGTGVNNSGKTITIGGNFTHTGAHTLGLTTSANTSVTLPTTGTLATIAGTETFTNKTLTTPIISSISNTGTLTLPTSTDTLVGRATTDTLTNKTLTLPTIGGTGATFNGSTSGTTTVVATATAGTTTLTLPAATDTLVGKATTDTLTNKTLSAAVLTGTLTAGGGVGTSGQILSSTGTGVQWITSSAGSSGTVTSIVAGTGLSGGTITTSGTIAIDSTVATLTGTQTLTNKSLTSPTVTGTLTVGGSAGTNGYYLQSTGSGVQWSEVSTTIGYNNSSLSSFPSGNYNGTDTYIGESGSAFDAFGVSLLATFTCMDPVGSLQTTDLGVLT